MLSDERATSLWLVPAEPDRAELKGHIDQLALAHGTPTFEPHVTLSSGIVDRAAVVIAIEQIAATQPPLELVAGKTGHGSDRFMAVFVELDDDRLHALARAMCSALDLEFDADGFRPHVSLLYARLPTGVRRSIAADHSLAARTLRFDTLAASTPGTDIDDVPRWQLPVVRPLTGTP